MVADVCLKSRMKTKIKKKKAGYSTDYHIQDHKVNLPGLVAENTTARQLKHLEEDGIHPQPALLCMP